MQGRKLYEKIRHFFLRFTSVDVHTNNGQVLLYKRKGILYMKKNSRRGGGPFSKTSSVAHRSKLFSKQKKNIRSICILFFQIHYRSAGISEILAGTSLCGGHNMLPPYRNCLGPYFN